MAVSEDQVKDYLATYLTERLEREGRAMDFDLADDFDLLLAGAVDSLGLLDLLTALQEEFKMNGDFEEMDPEQLTIVGPICTHVAQQANAENG